MSTTASIPMLHTALKQAHAAEQRAWRNYRASERRAEGRDAHQALIQRAWARYEAVSNVYWHALLDYRAAVEQWLTPTTPTPTPTPVATEEVRA